MRLVVNWTAPLCTTMLGRQLRGEYVNRDGGGGGGGSSVVCSPYPSVSSIEDTVFPIIETPLQLRVLM